MVHAIEAYTSKIKKNPYADMLAKQALKLLNQNLSLVLEDGRNLEARQNMLVGSMLAGASLCQCPSRCCSCACLSIGWAFSHFSWTQ